MTTAMPPFTPVQPAKMTCRLFETGGGLEIHRSRRNIRGSLFLILWLVGWSVGCVALAVGLIREPRLFMLLFATPFFAAWLAVAAVVTFNLLGFEGVRLDRSGLSEWKGLGGWRFTDRHTPLAELQAAVKHRASYEVNDQPVYGVEVQTLGKPVIFGVGLQDDERDWLIDRVNIELERLGVRRTTVAAPADYPVPQPPAALAPADLPADSDWISVPDAEGMLFTRRGQTSFTYVFGMAFVCLFWNGIVGVFVLVLLGLAPIDQTLSRGEWWILFAFLIPFEIVGVLLIVQWLGAVAMPWRQWSLLLGGSEIVYRRSLGLFSRASRYPTGEIQRVAAEPMHGQKQVNTLAPASGTWRLRFIDRTGREVWALPSLTEGEVHWMATQVTRRYGGRITR